MVCLNFARAKGFHIRLNFRAIESGTVVIMDERVSDTFTARSNDAEWIIIKPGQNSIYTSLMAAKAITSKRKTVVFMPSASVAQPSSTTAFTF